MPSRRLQWAILGPVHHLLDTSSDADYGWNSPGTGPTFAKKLAASGMDLANGRIGIGQWDTCFFPFET